MLTEVGRVVAVEPESLWVETIRQSTCGTCAAQKGCGHGLMNRVTDGKRSYIRVLRGQQPVQHCDVDDQVLISIPEEVILKGSFIAYMFPLVCMLLGAMAATSLMDGSADVAAALGAVSGLALGFVAVRWHAVRHQQDPAFQPVLVEVIQPSAQTAGLVQAYQQ